MDKEQLNGLLHNFFEDFYPEDGLVTESFASALLGTQLLLGLTGKVMELTSVILQLSGLQLSQLFSAVALYVGTRKISASHWRKAPRKMLGRFRTVHAKPLLHCDKIRNLSCPADILFPGYQPIQLCPVLP